MLIILRSQSIIENQIFVDKNLINGPPYGGSLSSGVVYFPFVNLFSFHHQFGLSSFYNLLSLTDFTTSSSHLRRKKPFP